MTSKLCDERLQNTLPRGFIHKRHALISDLTIQEIYIYIYIYIYLSRNLVKRARKMGSYTPFITPIREREPCVLRFGRRGNLYLTPCVRVRILREAGNKGPFGPFFVFYFFVTIIRSKLLNRRSNGLDYVSVYSRWATAKKTKFWPKFVFCPNS